MLSAEKSGKFRPGNFSIRNDDCSAEVLALPALSSSSLLTALKRTGRQICASRVLLLLLLLRRWRTRTRTRRRTRRTWTRTRTMTTGTTDSSSSSSSSRSCCCCCSNSRRGRQLRLDDKHLPDYCNFAC